MIRKRPAWLATYFNELASLRARRERVRKQEISKNTILDGLLELCRILLVDLEALHHSANHLQGETWELIYNPQAGSTLKDAKKRAKEIGCDQIMWQGGVIDTY